MTVQRFEEEGFTFKPITLPELPGPDALIACSLVVQSSCHGSAVDGVDYAVGGKEPPDVEVSIPL